MTANPVAAAPDPFEPTPLTNIMQSHSSSSSRSTGQPLSQQPMLSANPAPIPNRTSLSAQTSSSRYNPTPTAIPHRSSSSGGNYTSTPMQPTHPSSNSRYQQQPSSVVTSSGRPATAAQIAAAKKAKDQFLMFTRVLMKYLESKDQQMHARAKAVIRECAERNKKKEQGYESVTASMKKRLRQTVGEQYWKRAESYLLHFVDMRRKKQQQQPGGSSSTSSATQQQQMMLQQQQLQQQQQQKLQNEKMRHQKMQQQKQHEQQKILMEQQKKREMEKRKIQKQKEEMLRKQQNEKIRQQKLQQSRENKEQAAAAAKAARATKAESTKRRGSNAKRSGTPVTSATTSAPEVVDDAPREYNEFMEMIDHAVNYDWTTAPTLLAQKDVVDLDTEQQNLLYGNARPKISTDHKLRRGWTDRNVVSTRTAWAKVRLPELDRNQASSAMRYRWLNEERAEEDRTLALLSEASQIYIKDIFSKALECARQRENLQGIRLWHMQHSTKTDGNNESPPMGLRLGCDVSRQVALAEGNAALTVKRMEEALKRRKRNGTAEDVEDYMSNATSMGDLACFPKLASSVEKADYHAKRCFEVSGGKDSSSPPLGRVPKQAKIMAEDFEMGMELCGNDGRPHRPLAFHFV
eukprot:CAMPEP_0178909154 /NCGR_PEP_ID=MMETSP0786-20121207/8336_1 /TAXON_ID=186022 /ORGANISM="Thalassionema frauenfeldii, Strain CCMP 1798" /LENGTH=632 /DNA_ID=CAMNT_0020581167 /DNA_START=121 /DNA_END=2019 /DNA_ORIENTATION=+